LNFLPLCLERQQAFSSALADVTDDLKVLASIDDDLAADADVSEGLEGDEPLISVRASTDLHSSPPEQPEISASFSPTLELSPQAPEPQISATASASQEASLPDASAGAGVAVPEYKQLIFRIRYNKARSIHTTTTPDR
jgi:hypothetical protein